MPITTIGSYPPTLAQFAAHWGQVNMALEPDALLLVGGYSIENLDDDRLNLIAANDAIIALENTAAIGAGSLANAKEAIRARMIQFRLWVSGYLGATGYLRALPETPRASLVESRFTDPLQDALNVWQTINGDATLNTVPKPVVLGGGYTAAMFATELATLRALFLTAKTAAESLTVARKNRDTLLRPIEQRLKQYREVVPARLPLGSGLVDSLPALSPAPGSTPEAVELTGAWNAGVGRVRLNWTPSDNAKLLRYVVRVCTGKIYKVANEFTVADVDKSLTTLDTLGGVPIGGASAVYRVYVVVESLNERGSNDAPVTRPAVPVV